jgi:ribosomal protein L40E
MPKTPATRMKVCGRCNTRYGADEWRALESRGSIASSELRSIVNGWPDAAAVELRSCRSCGATLAMRAG